MKLCKCRLDLFCWYAGHHVSVMVFCWYAVHHVSVMVFCWYAGHHVSVMVLYCVCRVSSGCIADYPLFEAMLCFLWSVVPWALYCLVWNYPVNEM